MTENTHRVRCKSCGHYQNNGPELGSRNCERCGCTTMMYARRSSDRAAAVLLELAKLDATVRELATEHGVPLARLLERVQATYDQLTPLNAPPFELGQADLLIVRDYPICRVRGCSAEAVTDDFRCQRHGQTT